MSVAEFFQQPDPGPPIDLSEPPSQSPSTPVSISSESSEHTLSSGDDWTEDEDDDLELIGEIHRVDGDVDSYTSSSSLSPEQESAEYTQFLDGLFTQVVDREVFRTDTTGLVNQPQLIHFIKDHSGRVKCAVCDDRIRRDQIRIDYRPAFRSAQVKHTHVVCAGSNRALYFPSRGAELISFAEGFTEDEKTEFVRVLQASLPSEQNARGRLYPVVRGGDAHELAVERRRRNEELRQQLSHTIGGPRYLFAREALGVQRGSVGFLFPTTYGQQFQSAYRGLSAEILESLPRVSVTPTEGTNTPEQEEHTCVVCLEPMTVDQKIIMLPCFHRFHEGCISTWLRNSKQCPIDKLNVEDLLRDGGSSQSIPYTLR